MHDKMQHECNECQCVHENANKTNACQVACDEMTQLYLVQILSIMRKLNNFLKKIIQPMVQEIVQAITKS